MTPHSIYFDWCNIFWFTISARTSSRNVNARDRKWWRYLLQSKVCASRWSTCLRVWIAITPSSDTVFVTVNAGFRHVPFNSMNTWNHFWHYPGNPCLLATLWENEWADFHEIVNKGWTWDKEESRTFFWILVSPLNPGSIFLFWDSWLLAILWKNGWTDFHKIFMKGQGRHKNLLARVCCTSD